MALENEASFLMGDFFNSDAQTQPPQPPDQAGHLQFDIRLKYVINNKYGAKLYSDPVGPSLHSGSFQQYS
jgi:hypothetical protein